MQGSVREERESTDVYMKDACAGKDEIGSGGQTGSDHRESKWCHASRERRVLTIKRSR